MRPISSLSAKCVFGFGLILGLFVPFVGASAQDTTLYTFTGGGDGGNPPCGLISGGKGVLPSKAFFYGTTQAGGTSGYGTVFEVGKTGSESAIYSFTGGTDGAYPLASVITDPAGNIYGTTEEGGLFGYGVVFKVAPGGAETVLHSFAGGGDGAHPFANLIIDASGNLYGTTFVGGTNDLGTVFEVATDGTESVLHSFAGKDGALPVAGLVMDAAGSLYGTTSEGGASKNCSGGCGTVFKLAGGTESVLHSFAGSDGAIPEAAVIMKANGDLFGTTESGGAKNEGTVFEVLRKGKEVVLYSFGGAGDGANPLSALLRRSGYLYGTTSAGGTSGNGTVFKLPDTGGADTVIYSFTGGSDGSTPEGGVLNLGGNLYGTTYAGGDAGCDADQGCGVVFEITP